MNCTYYNYNYNYVNLTVWCPDLSYDITIDYNRSVYYV